MRDLLQHKEVGPLIHRRFDCVLVDEYQDTNPLQSEILQALCPTGEGLCAVGDDAQSIYSFRAATVRNILDFPKQFPGASVLKLQQNYRSAQPLLAVSNEVIAQAAERYDKDLWSNRIEGNTPQLVECLGEHDQADWVVETIKQHRKNGVSLNKQAVLFRASHHSIALETALMSEQIPFVKYGGLKFVESAHVKDFLAFFRLAENYKDSIAAQRVFLLLPGIGPKKAGQCISTLSQASTGLQVLSQLNPPASGRAQWKGFCALMNRLTTDFSLSLTKQLELALEFYAPLLEERYDDAKVRLRDLQQLIALSDRFETRQQMLVDLTLDPPNNSAEVQGKKSSEPALILSTIHSAKGLEWPIVFVISVAEGMIPFMRSAGSREGLEEERRLLYVALTRAADWLYVTYPRMVAQSWNSFSMPRGGPSQFLSNKVKKLFERKTATA